MLPFYIFLALISPALFFGDDVDQISGQVPFVDEEDEETSDAEAGDLLTDETEDESQQETSDETEEASETETPEPQPEEEPEVAAALRSYVSGPEDGYNIELIFEGDWTAEEQVAVTESADFLSEVIIADVPDTTADDGIQVDDLVIQVNKTVDEVPLNALGFGEVLQAREGTHLPSFSAMTFDGDDIELMRENGSWDSTVLHEMVHALGFGITWVEQDLVQVDENGTPRFTGANAISEYLFAMPQSEDDAGAQAGIPVEGDGPGESFASHWDEELFGDEFMTGEIDDQDSYSIMTIAALEDMGYDTFVDDVTTSEDATAPAPQLFLNTANG